MGQCFVDGSLPIALEPPCEQTPSGHGRDEVDFTLIRNLEIQAFASYQSINENCQPGPQLLALQQPVSNSWVSLVELVNDFSDCRSGCLLLAGSAGERQQ